MSESARAILYNIYTTHISYTYESHNDVRPFPRTRHLNGKEKHNGCLRDTSHCMYKKSLAHINAIVKR